MSSANSIYLQLQKLSNAATKTTLDYNSKEANTAREWQKMMSDTSYQRSTQDLIKAHLNPVLAANNGGAQSYTTSAASGQAENAANAVANAYGATTSAAATKYAAQQSAAATRYAAEANVRAAAIAAEAQKFSAINSKSGSVAGVASNFAKDLYNIIQKKNANKSSGVESTVRGTMRTANKMVKSPTKYLVDTDKKWSWNNTTREAKTKINLQLRDLGLKTWTPKVRQWYIDATYNGDEKAGQLFNSYLRQYLEKQSNSSRHLARLRAAHS